MSDLSKMPFDYPEIGTEILCVGGPLDGKTRPYKGGDGLNVRVRTRSPELRRHDEPIDFGEYELHIYDLTPTGDGLVYLHVGPLKEGDA